MASVRQNIFRDSVRYVSSSYVAQCFDFLTGIVSRRLLGPALMGVWTFCQVIITYAKYSALGTTDAVVRDIPYHLTKGEKDKAEELQNLVFSFTMVNSLLISLGMWIYTFLVRHKNPPVLTFSLVGCGVIILIQRLYNLLVVYLRAHRNFHLISRLAIYSSAVNLIFIAVLTKFFKLYGYLAATVLTYIASIAFIQFFARFPLRLHYDKEKLKPVLVLGIPLLFTGVLNAFFLSLDKLLITKRLGFEPLGFYSIALMVQNYFFSLPNMLGVVLYPYFQEQYARVESAEGLTRHVLYPLLAMAGLLLIPMGLLWFMVPPLVSLVLPKFVPGIQAMQILLLGTYFRALIAQPVNFLITARKHLLLIPINLLSIAAGYLLIRLGIASGHGIVGVAAAMGVAYAFQFFLSLALSVREKLNLRSTARAVSVICGFFAYAVVILALLQFFGKGVNVWVLSTVRSAAYLAAMIPVLLVTEKETGAILLIRDYVLSKFRKKPIKNS